MALVDTDEVEIEPADAAHDDRRSDIEAAFDKHTEEAAAETAPALEVAPADEKPVDGRTQRERDEHGRFRPKAEDKAEAAPPKGRSRQTAQAELETPEGKPEKAAPKADPVENLPAAFKPTMLEAWKALPREAKEEIHRRESEQAALIAQTKPMREFVAEVQKAVAPYQALLQAEGGSIPSALSNYLQAATLMRQGSPLAKAQWIAKLTRTFTAQEHLGLLDQALGAEFGVEGVKPPTQEPGGYRPPQQEFRDPRVDQMLAQQQMQAQEQLRQGFEEAVNEKNAWVNEKQPEFLPWVKNRMATLLETAARDGEELGFDEAYDAACRTHPEVRKILMQREEAARAQPSAVQRSRRASVSIRPQGAVAPPAASSADSRRSDIEAAWEEIMGR